MFISINIYGIFIVQVQIQSPTYDLNLKNGRNYTKRLSVFQGNARHQIALTLKEIQQR